MSGKEQEENHMSPCDNLTSFKRLTIAILGIQATMVTVSLLLMVSTMNRVSVVAEKQVQLAERQRVIEQKADSALSDANKALAISGKSEADIAWIREGFTELKMLVRNAINDKGNQ
jgi:hypothetical protein